MNIIDILGRVDNISGSTEANQTVFEEMAHSLFSKFCIQKGDETFYFLEVEFYYHTTGHSDEYTDTERKKTWKVYERRCPQHGMWMLHDSGVDICFKTETDPNGVPLKYGGILIRSLLHKDSKGTTVITGPSDCAEALFNFTSGELYPIIQEIPGDGREVALKAVSRRNYKSEGTSPKYGFYDSNYMATGAWAASGEKLERFNPRLGSSSENRYTAKPWNNDK